MNNMNILSRSSQHLGRESGTDRGAGVEGEARHDTARDAAGCYDTTPDHPLG